ncbi:hypothetical protein ACQ4PT_065004 [Festuca glaucescens]
MVVYGRYCVEVYVQFRCGWDTAQAREALDGRALYDGCCFLKLEHVPLIYTKITTPDNDELVPEYFYDDTPYAEWVAASAATECSDVVSATHNHLQNVADTDVTQIESPGIEPVPLDLDNMPEVVVEEPASETTMGDALEKILAMLKSMEKKIVLLDDPWDPGQAADNQEYTVGPYFTESIHAQAIFDMCGR